MITKFEVGKKYVFHNGTFPTIYTCTQITPLGHGILQWKNNEIIEQNSENYNEYVETKKGWLNIYNRPKVIADGIAFTGTVIYETKEAADRVARGDLGRTACIEVTWKPGEGL